MGDTGMWEMVWYCVLTNFVGMIFIGLSEYVKVAEWGW